MSWPGIEPGQGQRSPAGGWFRFSGNTYSVARIQIADPRRAAMIVLSKRFHGLRRSKRDWVPLFAAAQAQEAPPVDYPAFERHRKVKVARLDCALIFLFSGDVEMSYLPPGVHGGIS